MQPFDYLKVGSQAAALEAARRGGRFIAGGTCLVDLMREEVERPATLIDISALQMREIVATGRGGLRIGALVTMAAAAADPHIRTSYPLISEALELSASAQLRNMATIGGNVLQRTRCTYFRDLSAACNKRAPGSGCAAREGYNRSHAILGTSAECVATHPSDLAVALAALDAVIHLVSGSGSRRVAITDFLIRPGSAPEREHALRDAELITAVEVPALPRPVRSGYLKVRDRQSYEFALASAAVALATRDGVIRAARVAAGGVGTVPWRLHAVEQRLVGGWPSAQLWRFAAECAADGAEPLRHNAFKVDLLRRTVERQLRIVGQP
ncbi:FAD binding domain-containing protein [Pseudonocardia sp. TRM90224]|uniref:FAD binding domain-containing protein n=1 Tax=Pseudonocardia sp. TRM90224 TaxID=2812678 RepID=UPI001E495568|nr:FAD binding domain-containing protein [Pseudonocardia sp. TRM90224]